MGCAGGGEYQRSLGGGGRGKYQGGTTDRTLVDVGGAGLVGSEIKPFHVFGSFMIRIPPDMDPP